MNIRDKLKGLRRYLVGRMIRCVAVPASVTTDSAVIVAPHPDDEVLGCGGIIAMKRELGIKVSIIFLTDGEASHHRCCSTSSATVARVRKELAVAAGNDLGLLREEFYWLGLPDGSIPRKGDAGFEAAVNRLADLMITIAPSEIYAPHPADSWPDHEAASVLTELAMALTNNGAGASILYYPVWLWHNLRLRSLPFVLRDQVERIDISTVKEKKRAGIFTYLARINPNCGKPVCGSLPESFPDYFDGNYEYYLRHRQRSCQVSIGRER